MHPDPAQAAKALAARQAFLWLNPSLTSAAQALPALPLQFDAIQTAAERWQRFAPLLAGLFPETASSGGVIESELLPVPALRRELLGPDAPGHLYIKADHALPIAGSIKARGGIHEVLEFAERLACEHGLLTREADYRLLATDPARALFSRYTVAVGSTGNLGMSIGIIAAALGFRAQVHMSAEAKAWKKRRLRDHGVEVIEHAGDYGAAVEAGRAAMAADPHGYFVDDERSLSLFLGYAVAALRLREQLQLAGIAVDRDAPLFVYLPCGVGGAPAGIAFGLKQVFGDHVHCFFAEPTAAPCVLAQMSHPDRPGISVYDLGLDNCTAADGLAVARASELAVDMMRELLSGVFTVQDETMFRHLYVLRASEGMRIEPSAAAGFSGPEFILRSETGRRYLEQRGLLRAMDRATHILWTTGGLFVPDDEFQGFLTRGAKLGDAID